MEELKVSDSILSATEDGVLKFDTVSSLSIVKLAEQSFFVVLVTADNKTLELTPDHHLPVGETCCATLMKAKDVALGQLVWTVSSSDYNGVATPIVEIKSNYARGLHSPVLVHGGFPIVQGVVTSFDSIRMVKIASYFVPLWHKLCSWTGIC
ncbi:hypothetical protein AB1Y20_020785 [Prymnesium parvum]|uniref:Hedgehog protein Hint domain-containing protein n=1 Tax=Prymnesium parvum TaxID=97485 RepID=A0AB34JUK8_PRYPA